MNRKTGVAVRKVDCQGVLPVGWSEAHQIIDIMFKLSSLQQYQNSRYQNSRYPKRLNSVLLQMDIVIIREDIVRYVSRIQHSSYDHMNPFCQYAIPTTSSHSHLLQCIG